MSPPPLVSILIPCHNAAPWIRATLESAVAQTWRYLEIIVVDDGSTDTSASIAEEFAPQGVTLIRQPKRGQSAAFNTAIRAASGDYYEFLDADDLIAPDKIAVQIGMLSRLPPRTICSGAWARFREHPAEAVFSAEPVWRDLDPVDWLVTSWSGGGMMHGAAWLVPSGVVRTAGVWTESLSLTNDFDFFTRIVLASRGVAFCPDARSYYRSGHGATLSGGKSHAALQSAFDSIVLGTTALLATEDSLRTRHACAVSYMRFVHSYYPRESDIMKRAEQAAEKLGGCDLRPEGGDAFCIISRLVGWKCARHLQWAWFKTTGRI